MASKLPRLILVGRHASVLPALTGHSMHQKRTIVSKAYLKLPGGFSYTRYHAVDWTKKRLHQNSVIEGNIGSGKSTVASEMADISRPVYVEEDYLEEEEEDFDEPLDSRHPDPNRPSSHLIRPEEVVTVLEAEKAKNIEVVECTNPNSPYQFLIIASPYNERHGQALIETVRRYFCRKYYFGKMNPRKKVEANGWYALDFHNSVLHIMKDHLRQKYNLAKVWSEEETENAEEEIDPEMFPTPKDDDLQVASHRRAVPIIKANS